MKRHLLRGLMVAPVLAITLLLSGESTESLASPIDDAAICVSCGSCTGGPSCWAHSRCQPGGICNPVTENDTCAGYCPTCVEG